MKKTIGTIQGVDLLLVEVDQIQVVEFTADLDIDCDGTGGNPHGDPYFQPDTRLHYRGKALCAEQVPYLVVPPLVLSATRGKVLGCSAKCTNIQNKRVAWAVVGDSGPLRKIGEGSPRLARLLGLDDNPNYGGTSEKIISVEIFVGSPATIDGITYDLQSA